MKRSCIEYVWKECWENCKHEIILSDFPIYPDARGVNSSGNKYTISKRKLFVKNLFLKFGYYTVRERRRLNAMVKRNCV